MSRLLDGINDEIDTNFNGVGNGAKSHLIWVKPLAQITESGSSSIVGHHRDGTGTVAHWLYTGVNNQLVAQNPTYNTTDPISTSVNDVIPNGEWSFVAMTFAGGSGNFIDIFKNGEEVSYASRTASFGSENMTSVYDFMIGNNGDNSYPFTGFLAYALLYNRKLTKPEIQQLMYYPGSITRSMQGFWPLWGRSTPEPDLSFRRNGGTVAGALPCSEGPPICGLYLPRHFSRNSYVVPAAAPAPAPVAATGRRITRNLVGVGL